MITDKQIVNGAKEAIGTALKFWLDENKAGMMEIVPTALKRSLVEYCLEW